MKLLEKTWQHHYDWNGILQCEFCLSTQYHEGCYDDGNFYDNVIPAIRCVKCSQRTNNTLREERYGEGISVVKKDVIITQWQKETK